MWANLTGTPFNGSFKWQNKVRNEEQHNNWANNNWANNNLQFTLTSHLFGVFLVTSNNTSTSTVLLFWSPTASVWCSATCIRCTPNTAWPSDPDMEKQATTGCHTKLYHFSFSRKAESYKWTNCVYSANILVHLDGCCVRKMGWMSVTSVNQQ